MQQKIVTFLWFDNQAEEAAKHYASIFPDSTIKHVQRNPDGGPGPKGQALVVDFQLAGQDFLALNGGPDHKFTEAISLFVRCENQAEVDRLWAKLLEGGGREDQCGWLKDKYGLSWQVIPNQLMELMGDKDPETSGRVMQAMMKMVKIDIAGLRRAYEGR